MKAIHCVKRFFAVKRFKERNSARVSSDKNHMNSIVELLDSSFNGSGKIKRNLEAKEVESISSVGAEYLNSLSTEILDVLNDSLNSSKMNSVFPVDSTLGCVVEIDSVSVDERTSHVTAYWASPMLAQFLQTVHNKLGNDSFAEFEKQSSLFVTAKLQHQEPVFRTFLSSRLNFRRVPRITFHAQEKIIEKNDQRQLFLRSFNEN